MTFNKIRSLAIALAMTGVVAAPIASFANGPRRESTKTRDAKVMRKVEKVRTMRGKIEIHRKVRREAIKHCKRGMKKFGANHSRHEGRMEKRAQ